MVVYTLNQARLVSLNPHVVLVDLTSDHLGHVAGGVDATDVLGMRGVGDIAKQQS